MGASDTDTTAASFPRGLASRALAIVLGLALPTGFFSWLLGFDPIKKRINGRLWCSDADTIVFQVNVSRSGSSSRYSDELLCRKDGTLVRTIGDLRMTATTIGISFAISLVLFSLLVVCLLTYARLRRRRRARCERSAKEIGEQSTRPFPTTGYGLPASASSGMENVNMRCA